MKKKILIIDTFNLLHRAYHAIPKTLTDKEGNPTNAIYGVTSMLISILDQIKPDYVIIANDSKKPTFRVEEFTGYKAHRKPMDDELAYQIDKLYEIIDSFGVKSLTVDGYEADDIIGTIVNKYKKNNEFEVIICSNDRDLWQLVDENIFVMSPKGSGNFEIVKKEDVVNYYGFNPSQIPDYKGLKGDPSDNLPGVYGVGDKTAKKLISEYGSLEKIYLNLEKITPPSLRKKLEESYEQALQSKKLATIINNVPMSFNIDEAKYLTFNKIKVKEILEKYNFKSLIKRLGFGEYKNSISKIGGSKSNKSSKQPTLF